MRKSRRFLALFSAITLLFSSTFMPSASENDAKFDDYSNMGDNAVANGYSTPNLFRQNGVYSNMETFPLVVQNGVEYVPMSVFILYPYVEVDYSKTDSDFFLVNNKNNHYISFNVEEGIASTHDGDLLKMPTPIFNQTRYIPARTVAVVLGFESETYDDPENGIYAFRVSDGNTGQTLEELMEPYIAEEEKKKQEEKEKNEEKKKQEENEKNEKNEETESDVTSIPQPQEDPNVIYMPEGWEPPNSNKNESKQEQQDDDQKAEQKTENNEESEQKQDPKDEYGKRYIGLCYTGLSYDGIETIVDSLKKNKIRASFSFTAEEILARAELVRDLEISGHSIFVTSSASGTTPEEYADEFISGLEEANDALKLVSKKKTRMCTLPYDIPEEIKNSNEFNSRLEQAGYLVFTPSVETSDSPSYKGSAYTVSSEIKNEVTGGFDKNEDGYVTALVYCSNKTYYYTVDLAVFARDYKQFEFFAMDEAFLYNS